MSTNCPANPLEVLEVQENVTFQNSKIIFDFLVVKLLRKGKVKPPEDNKKGIKTKNMSH